MDYNLEGSFSGKYVANHWAIEIQLKHKGRD
jgi:hypothetical protein